MRLVWPIVFFLPLGVLAGRFCWINIVDPAYHSLVWLHERLFLIVLALAVISVAAATIRFRRLQRNLNFLMSFSIVPSVQVLAAFDRNARRQHVLMHVNYIDAPHAFCFTIFQGPSVIISRGFVDQLSDSELELVAQHEVLHVRRKDPWRAFAWHLFFAGLILPVFEVFEQLVHLRRERSVDDTVRLDTGQKAEYDALLKHCSQRHDQEYGAVCSGGLGVDPRLHGISTSNEYLWNKSLPALASLAILCSVLASHAFFMRNLAYLTAHHC